jgi:hypothetical protein
VTDFVEFATFNEFYQYRQRRNLQDLHPDTLEPSLLFLYYICNTLDSIEEKRCCFAGLASLGPWFELSMKKNTNIKAKARSKEERERKS